MFLRYIAKYKDPIEIRSAKRPVHLEVIQFKALIPVIVNLRFKTNLMFIIDNILHGYNIALNHTKNPESEGLEIIPNLCTLDYSTANKYLHA